MESLAVLDPPKATNATPVVNERRLANGRARGLRYAYTTDEHLTVDTRLCFFSVT